jgi:hypothetical protein
MDINFNLEETIDEIIKEIEYKREEAKQKGVEYKPQHEKQIVREKVGEKLGKPSVPAQPAPVQLKPHVREEERSYENPELREHVSALIKIALEKNLEDAIQAVQKQGNPALLDAFHDALVDHFYEELVKRGKLKA